MSRLGMDKGRSLGREEAPFVVRVRERDGEVSEITAQAVVDASGTWGRRNPLGASGLPARGEEDAMAAGLVVGPLPDVLGRDRHRFAGRRTLVVGAGHSAANTLVDLARLAEEVPGTEVVWAVRRADASRLYGGGEADELRPAVDWAPTCAPSSRQGVSSTSPASRRPTCASRRTARRSTSWT